MLPYKVLSLSLGALIPMGRHPHPKKECQGAAKELGARGREMCRRYCVGQPVKSIASSMDMSRGAVGRVLHSDVGKEAINELQARLDQECVRMTALATIASQLPVLLGRRG